MISAKGDDAEKSKNFWAPPWRATWRELQVDSAGNLAVPTLLLNHSSSKK